MNLHDINLGVVAGCIIVGGFLPLSLYGWYLFWQDLQEEKKNPIPQ